MVVCVREELGVRSVPAMSIKHSSENLASNHTSRDIKKRGSARLGPASPIPNEDAVEISGHLSRDYLERNIGSFVRHRRESGARGEDV